MERIGGVAAVVGAEDPAFAGGSYVGGRLAVLRATAATFLEGVASEGGRCHGVVRRRAVTAARAVMRSGQQRMRSASLHRGRRRGS
ncbi:hypothetical protein [Xylophilus sp.]|uniref:hypothetical protein n=1 Tax=Xylophilus sp. TaxID=2653893 RepID=UPI0013BDE9EE|nr:hypothetical protein [Xylophilus sp.]KAF1046754.1 MAG: hypothetical protein GAK38_02317 [Xylophilus sp.]